MKHKLQTLLKHKLQWLLLLTALLGVSQGVWGTDYYITGAVGTGGWGTWVKMTSDGNNIYHYDCTSLGEFKFSDTNNYNETFYKSFTGTGDQTGVELENNCSSNGNCKIKNLSSGYTYPVRFSINTSTKNIWVTATKVPDNYYLRGNIPGVGWGNNTAMTNSSGTYTYSVNISTTGNYSFKLYKSTSQWLGKDGTTISGTSTINDFYFADSGDKGNNITLKADVAGSYNFSFNVSAKTLTVTFPSSCTTVTSTSVGGSATLTLSNGAAEAITSSTTYNGSRTPEGSGDTYLWTVSPSPFTGATTIETSTATSTTIRFRREGQYSVKFAAGCSSASVESSAYTVNVYPGSLYVAGPLFKGSGIWNQTETMSKSGSGTSAVYTKDLTVAYAGGEFTFQSVTSAGASNYILPHYCTTSGGSSYTNITRSGSGNNNLTSSFTLANGDNVQLKVAYRGANASGEPKYDFSLCRYPTASGFTMNRTSATYTGSNLTVTVSPKDGYGAVSNIKYAGTTNAGATYSKSSTGPTEAGTYTVYADIAAYGTWCAKEQLEIGTFTIERADQATLTVSNSTTSTCMGSTFTLKSSGGSGDGAVTFAIVSDGTGTGSISGTTLSASAAGTILVQATKAQSANFNEATSATKTFTFNPKPTAGTISGSTSACSGVAGGVSLTLSEHTTTGTNIQWKKKVGDASWSNIGDPTTETTLSTSQTVETKYRAYVTYTATGCYSYTSNKTVPITPNMALTSIALTETPICIGGTSDVTLTGLNLGGVGAVTYTSGAPAVATIAAKDPATTGATATAVTAGTSEIKVTVNGGCGSKVEKTLTLTVNPNAAAGNFTLSNNSKPYNTESQSPTITAAAGMGTYTTYYTGKSGTVYAKSETAPTNAGTYDVTVHVTGSGASFCPASEFSIGDFEITKIDQPHAVTIDNETTSYCVSTLGTDIPLEASGGDGTGAYSFTITGGTVAADKRSISGSTLTVSGAGTVILQATRVADTNYNAKNSATVTFTFTANGPKVFTLTNEGATALCGKGDGSSTGTGGSLRLTGSEIGYSYQLKKDDANYGDPVAGTGSALTFPVTSSGVYTCTAYYGDPSQCPTEMNVEDGGIVLVVNITPRLLPGTPTVRQYQAVTITSTNTEIDKWVLSGEGSDAYTYDSTPNSITLKANTAGSPYRLIATTSAGCTATAVITVIADTENCVP